jgi:hypothetical protein
VDIEGNTPLVRSRSPEGWHTGPPLSCEPSKDNSDKETFFLGKTTKKLLAHAGAVALLRMRNSKKKKKDT